MSILNQLAGSLSLVIGLSVASSASALVPPYLIEREADSIAFTLRQKGSKLSPEQRVQIAKKLDSIRIIMSANVPTYPPANIGPMEFNNFTCVSRDNDGAAPYVIGVSNSTARTIIKGDVFKTLQDCKYTLSEMQTIGRSNFICTSRDSDGTAPYHLSDLQETGLYTFKNTVILTKIQCSELLTSLQYHRDHVSFCASKDNDSVAPFIAIRINLQNRSELRGNKTFSTLDLCQQNVSIN